MIDPVSAALIAATVAGATGGLTDVSKTALMDAYTALKAAIQQRFGQHHALVKAVEAVEAKPTSVGRQTTLVEEVTDADAAQDRELLTLAEQLRQVLKEQAKTNPVVQQIITGNYNATSVHGNASVTVQPPKEE